MAKQRFVLSLSVLLGCSVAACGLDTQPSSVRSPSVPAGPMVDGPRESESKPPQKPEKPSEDEPTPPPDEAPEPDDSEPPAESEPPDATTDEPMQCASCDDRKACTSDVRVTGTCRCTHAPIVDALDGDGCCPAGMSQLDDLDCERTAECGNGHVDEGEQCDGGAMCAADCTLLFTGTLIHRYSFDGEGRDVLDSVGTAHGRAVNAMLDGSGELSLSGSPSNGHVELPAGLFNRLTSATIETWVTTTRGGGGQRIFDIGSRSAFGEPQTYWALTAESLFDGNAMTLLNLSSQADYGAQDQVLSSRESVTPSRLHCLTVTFDGESGTLALYLDGAPQGSRRVSGQLSELGDSNAWLGRAQYEDYPYLQARIQEFRIYSTALTRAQVAQSYEAGPDPARPN